MLATSVAVMRASSLELSVIAAVAALLSAASAWLSWRTARAMHSIERSRWLSERTPKLSAVIYRLSGDGWGSQDEMFKSGYWKDAQDALIVLSLDSVEFMSDVMLLLTGCPGVRFAKLSVPWEVAERYGASTLGFPSPVSTGTYAAVIKPGVTGIVYASADCHAKTGNDWWRVRVPMTVQPGEINLRR